MRSHETAPRLGRASVLLTTVALLLTVGCKDLNVPNYTNADVGLLENNPDASVINLMSTGLLSDIRSGHEGLETYGRNAYNLDPTEVRSVTVPLIGPLQSGGYWPYSDIRNCYAILHALDKVGSLMTDAQKAGVRGFTKTILAYNFHSMLRVRYQHGGFIDVDRDKFGPLAPWADGKAVLDHILTLLDDAQTDLTAAGSAFSFPLTRGFQTDQGGANFSTPAGFLQFNRALKARVEVYAATWDTPNAAQHWNAALTALGGTWINPAATPPAGPSPALTIAQLDVGPKHTYGPSTADGTNGLLDNSGRQRFVHPSVIADAEIRSIVPSPTAQNPARTDTIRDERVVRKTIAMGTRDPVTGQLPVKGILGLSSSWRWNLNGTGSGLSYTVAATSSTPIPIIRNEELILLRAEANLGLGNTSLAIQDINLIRVNSGKLPQISDPYVPTGTQPATLLEELLYEKRYSLLYEFGHRWVDLSRYGMLATLPKDDPSHRIWPALPFDETECNFRRDENLSGCPVGGEIGF